VVYLPYLLVFEEVEQGTHAYCNFNVLARGFVLCFRVGLLHWVIIANGYNWILAFYLFWFRFYQIGETGLWDQNEKERLLGQK
jgi:hypothetical protein